MWRLVCSIPAALVIVRMAMAFMVIGALTLRWFTNACHNHNRRTNWEKIEPGLLEFMMTKCFGGGGESAGRREGHYLVIARFQSSLLVCHPLLS